MTDEEIVVITKQANIVNRNYVFFSRFCEGISQEDLKTFAKLVAEKEREACANICDSLAYNPEFASDVTKLASMAIKARKQND